MIMVANCPIMWQSKLQTETTLSTLVGNVLDMSLGRGHVKKSQGQNQLAGYIFDRIFSVTCPSRVPRVSHVSDTIKKQRKRESKFSKSSELALE